MGKSYSITTGATDELSNDNKESIYKLLLDSITSFHQDVQAMNEKYSVEKYTDDFDKLKSESEQSLEKYKQMFAE